jgi:hypothetical protein
MSFFNSDIIRNEMNEIKELQEIIYENVFKFPSMSNEDKIKHVNTLENLLDKQTVLYTRLCLSDDVEAKEMKKKIVKSCLDMGLSDNIDINSLFNKMSKTIQQMKIQLKNS